MKSKVKLLGALAISAISVLSYVQISHSEKLDDLLLENIEALAAGESGDDFPTIPVGDSDQLKVGEWLLVRVGMIANVLGVVQ